MAVAVALPGAIRLPAVDVDAVRARLVQTGDNVIIVAYCQIPAEEARNYKPTVVLLGDGNAIERLS